MMMLKPPQAAKRPHLMTIHNDTRADDYYWLREKESTAVIDHLEAENAYTDAMTAHTQSLQATLYDEMVSRIKETDESVPVKDGIYYYYSRTEAGKQYRIYCRKQEITGEEEILLDLNLIQSENQYEYLTLGIYCVSPDHQILAYGLDTTGAETHTIVFKDLTTGEQLRDVMEGVAQTAVWANSQQLIYGTEDQTKRQDKLYCHTLGTTQPADKLIYHELDALFNTYAYTTNDEKYVIVASTSSETSELHFVLAEHPIASLTTIEPRLLGVQYSAEHRNGLFYIVTNADDAIDFKLMTATVDKCGRKHWQELVPHREDTRLYDIELYANYLVRSERIDTLNTIHITHFESGDTHTVVFDEPIFDLTTGENAEYDTDQLRIVYTSLTTPVTIYDYDMGTRNCVLKKQQSVLGQYDREAYTSARVFAMADDGRRIPISLVYRKDAWDGHQPTHLHLYGYGSYGITIDPIFSTNRISLLDRGIVYAIAHVRGSQIMGRGWYEKEGKYLTKQNTFTDFIACANHLINTNYTTPSQMTMEGRSAGGLLIGAVLNMAPMLFAGAIAGVPFVDVVTTMLDESIPLTTGEWEEWGNPNEDAYYHYMLDYSPYDNVSAQAYPRILITAGLNDPRVQYWEPAKWAQKLRDMKTDQHPLLLTMFMGAGHFSSSGRYDYLKDIAFDYAFLLDVHRKVADD